MAMLAPSILPTLREWKIYLTSRGLRDDVTDEYLSYIRPLVKKNLPVIFDSEHLAALLGRTSHFVTKAAAAPNYYYRHFTLPKRSGGIRDINAPYPSLKECQQWIVQNILQRLPVSPFAMAYVQDRSILNHAQSHIGKDRGLLIIDLKDFFPSISKRRVIGLFRSFGYNNEVAITLGSLCCLDGSLPQGSPCSPYISNLIATHVDHQINAISKRFGLSYSRYADDICLSGPVIPSCLLRLIDNSLRSSGFKIKEEKTRFHSPLSKSKVLTGINISSAKPKLPRSRRRDIEHQMHFIQRFGYLSHIQNKKIRDPNYILRLRGHLEFWRFIEPENTKVLAYIEHISDIQRLQDR